MSNLRYMLTVYNSSANSPFAFNLGHWKTQDEGKKAAFLSLKVQFPDYYWSYSHEGWIDGSMKDGQGLAQAVLSTAIED